MARERQRGNLHCRIETKMKQNERKKADKSISNAVLGEKSTKVYSENIAYQRQIEKYNAILYYSEKRYATQY